MIDTTLRITVVLVALAVILAAWNVAVAEEKEDDEEKLTIDQVPAAVKATILKEAGNNEIKEIEKDTENGKTVYEAEWVADGKEVEIKVAPDGTLLSKEVEEEGDDEGEKEADDEDDEDDDDKDDDDDDDNDDEDD